MRADLVAVTFWNGVPFWYIAVFSGGGVPI